MTAAALVDDDHDDGLPLDADLDLPNDLPRGVFADSYGALRALGWLGVLWLPEGEKALPLGRTELPLRRSLTGYDGVDCDASELHLLASSILRRGRGRGFSGARGNIAVRAPQHVIKDGTAYDLIFLDVDDYVKGDETKTGAATVAAIEDAAGARFPATFKITSRGDSVSGKYAYLIPPNTKLVTSRPDVDLIQWFHRYAVAPPSINRSSNGTTVRAYRNAAPRRGECAGQLIAGMFRPEEAAIMPPELVAELRDEAGFQNAAGVGDPEVLAFLDALVVDPTDPRRMCKAVSNTVEKTRSDMRQAGSAFETTRGSVMRLLRLGNMGHVGVPTAFTELERAYVATQNAPRDTEQRARAEFQRMITNRRGVGLILADPTPEGERGCRCGPVYSDDELLSVLATGGEGLVVTLDEIRDQIGHDRYNALAARLAAAGNSAAVLAPVVPAVANAAVPSPRSATTNSRTAPALATDAELDAWVNTYISHHTPGRLRKRVEWMRKGALPTHAKALVTDSIAGHYPAKQAAIELHRAYRARGGTDPKAVSKLLAAALGTVTHSKAGAR